MPLASSLPSSAFPLPHPPVPPHASASSPTSSCTTTTDADPIYQNIEECRFLYDSPPSADRTIDKPSPTRPTLGASSSQPMDTPPGYRRINSASKASPIFSLPPPPPLDDHEQKPSTSRGSEQGRYETLSTTTSPVSYYDDLSDYGEHHLVASPARRSDFRPQSQPPEQLRRLGSQKGASLLSAKSSSSCTASCLCCLVLCTMLVFGLAYIIYFFFADIESWTKQNVINKL
ncbi:hypothetical protein PRIPAC_93014 [Pristionchus pacificus]|uniref:Uncharacterized protein n=1 Tax=Pristionchus pacificus TaxID=54126 RepID=A0A2A6CDU2_PRIPA|nr:hypothetical protein PRIPAC_93014 [Pristionchus pacificus]|eukprot:PDM76277.1 hypothetical protein PRIPAC_39881 [Pristionchus pacificus]